MIITLCVVLYKCSITESDTINSLTEYLTNNFVKNSYDVLVFDNSDSEQINLNSYLHYYANKENKYLCYNYNKALDFCKRNNSDWLVLLDQDTHLSKEYLDFIFNDGFDNNFAAYVPMIKSLNGVEIAPCYKNVRNKYNKKQRAIFSINSGTVLNVRFFIENIKMFSSKYPLDFLDNWYFQKINSECGRIKVLPIEITHDLSVSRGHSIVSIERYKSILQSECRFIYEERSSMDRFKYKLRLICRYIKWKIKGQKEHSALVKKFILNSKFIMKSLAED